MLHGWLLPDSSYALLREGWNRPIYRPKHCKPPLIGRAGQALGTFLVQARDRYLEFGDDEPMTRAPRPAS